MAQRAQHTYVEQTVGYWLVKSEPFKYSWDTFLRDKETTWDGVRNYQARNNLSAMQKGDAVLYYHSNEGKAVVGLAVVIKEAYPDPTDKTGKWVAVTLRPKASFPHPVTLASLKASPSFSTLGLIKQGRLSVMPVSEAHFMAICEMGGVSG